LLIAMSLRLPRLDAALLNADEARGALAAWRWTDGQGLPDGAGYSPALLAGQSLLFLLLSANELTARLLPALAGMALVVAPAWLRSQLGRVGALFAGALLALSPTAAAVSRTASGDGLAALGALFLGCGVWLFIDEGSPQRGETKDETAAQARPWLALAALGGGLMLASSPLAYSALIALAATLSLAVVLDPSSRRRILGAWRTFQDIPNPSGRAPRAEPQAEASGRSLARYTLLIFVGAFVLLSTALGWNLRGLGAAAGLFTQWLNGFVRWPDSLSAGYPALILVVYEPLILLAGGVGMALSAWRGHRLRPEASSRGSARGALPEGMALFLTGWTLVALGLSLLRPGHGPGDVLLALAPLACLGGMALDALLAATRRRGRWLNEGLYLGVSLPLWAYFLFNLASYSGRTWRYAGIHLPFTNVSLPTYLSVAGVALGVLLLVAMAMAWMQGAGPALRGLGLSMALALLVYTVSAAWGVSHNRPADPRELLALRPTAPEVRLLHANLARLGNERLGDAAALDLTVLSNDPAQGRGVGDPALVWALRDFSQARFAEVSGALINTSAVVAPEWMGTPVLESDYIGQSFPLRRDWSTHGLSCRWNVVPAGFDRIRQLDCSALVKWFLYRQGGEPPTEERVVLWVRREVVER